MEVLFGLIGIVFGGMIWINRYSVWR